MSVVRLLCAASLAVFVSIPSFAQQYPEEMLAGLQCPAARAVALQITIPTLLFLLIVLIPFLEIQSIVKGVGWDFSRSVKGNIPELPWILQLVGFSGWLTCFWWLGKDLPGTLIRQNPTDPAYTFANQSLRGMFTRTSASLTGGLWWWLAAAALAGLAGLITAARLHRAGRPVYGWLTCALTGLLVSPVSWDHHWVWVAPGLAVLADAAVRARSATRRACWALAGALAVLFGAWPMLGRPGPLVPWGLIWYAPGSPGAAASHPWSTEYHWQGLTWLAGNLYVLAGLVALAGLAVLARRAASPRGGSANPPSHFLRGVSA